MSASTISLATHRKALIGAPSSFWLHSTHNGFDLTHPPSHSESAAGPKATIKTTSSPITISPSKSALIIIDMQNFFLSSALDRAKGAGHAAVDALVKHAIPAARKAGIRVVWLNWGLTEQDVKEMPPAIKRCFGYVDVPAEVDFEAGDAAFGEHELSASVDKQTNLIFQGGEEVKTPAAKKGATWRGVGSEGGKIELEDGSEVDVGRLFMRGTWSAALYPPLDALYEEGSKLKENPDVWIHKNRMSGMWGGKGEVEEFLEKEGIRTLFFSGVNTDQCVGGTLTDAFSKGYDCVLLSDGAGTTSPEYAQQCFEYNAAMTFGFCTTCEEFAKGVDNLTT